MPLDRAGKYHMNPHHAKAADSAPPKQSAPSGDAAPDMGMGDDPQGGDPLMTCPACGAQFPESMGMESNPAQAAVPQSQPSGAPPAMSGY